MEYCKTKEEALDVETLVYNLAVKNHANHVCGYICSRTKYPSELNVLSRSVLSKELQTYGNGYLIIWMFYGTLNVEEKVETLLFDFNSAVVAVGGGLGLFVGWSLYSMITALIDYIGDFFDKSSTHTRTTSVIQIRQQCQQ